MCPILAVQGVQGTDDECGTMAQVQAIKSPSSLWPSPQRDQTDAVLAAIAGFVKRIGGNKSGAGGV